MNSTQIAQLLQRNRGNLSSKRWVGCCGSQHTSTAVLRWLDEIGVSEIRRVKNVHKRVLKVSLREAVQKVRKTPYRKHKSGRSKQDGRQPGSQVSESFVVVDDPTGLFKTGNRFPASQVLESESNPNKWLQPGELPDQMWMTYKGFNWVMDPERGLVKVEDDECWTVEDGILINNCRD